MAAALLAAQIDPDLLKQTEARISGEQFQAFIHHLLQQSGDPLFGLKSSEYVQPGSYSILGYIVMSCATLGEAIERILPYEKLVGDMGITTLEPEGDCILVRWHCAYPQPQVRAQMIDNVLASWGLPNPAPFTAVSRVGPVCPRRLPQLRRNTTPEIRRAEVTPSAPSARCRLAGAAVDTDTPPAYS